MGYVYLSETVEIKKVKETEKEGAFTISGLYPGYGLTLANSLRRVLLSSLPGAAITYVKIKGVDHEFSTIAGVSEDVIEINLNFKKVRFRVFSDEPQVLTLKIKGEKEAKAGDIKINSNVEVINSDMHIATLTTKGAELEAEITVEKGLGYSPVELRRSEKLSIGTIALDAFFSPVVKVNYTIDNIRVGDRTDYNQINLEITTDGSIKPSEALHKAANILRDHFEKVSSGLGGEEKEGKTEKIEEEEKKEGTKKKSRKRAEKKQANILFMENLA